MEVFSPEDENVLYEGALSYRLNGITFAPQTQQPLKLLMLNHL